MSNNKIKIGLIGAGDNTKLRHIPGFQKLNNVEIKCLMLQKVNLI